MCHITSLIWAWDLSAEAITQDKWGIMRVTNQAVHCFWENLWQNPKIANILAKSGSLTTTSGFWQPESLLHFVLSMGLPHAVFRADGRLDCFSTSLYPCDYPMFGMGCRFDRSSIFPYPSYTYRIQAMADWWFLDPSYVWSRGMDCCKGKWSDHFWLLITFLSVDFPSCIRFSACPLLEKQVSLSAFPPGPGLLSSWLLLIASASSRDFSSNSSS